MDRNVFDGVAALVIGVVALRKESVDRNVDEIQAGRCQGVALRKESVDRNNAAPSAADRTEVALRKESVDRNWAVEAPGSRGGSRSPQGERG